MDVEQDMEGINVLIHQGKDSDLTVDETDSPMKVADENRNLNKANDTHGCALLETDASDERVKSDVILLNSLVTSGEGNTNVEVGKSNNSMIRVDGDVEIRPNEMVKMDRDVEITPCDVNIEEQSVEDVKPIELEIKESVEMNQNSQDVHKVDNCIALVKYEIGSSEEDSSSSSDDEQSVSSSEVEDDIKKEKKAVFKCQDERLPPPPRTATEKTIAELPVVEEPVPKLHDDVKIKEFGFVSSIIGQLVVIQSEPNNPALNLDSLLFKEDRQYIGKIFEVFGPVICPLYAVRFNSTEHIKSTGVDLKMKVFYALDSPEFTSFVLMEQMKRMKGSDASWKNDEEPPSEFLDYSDDEKEKEAKCKNKGNRRKRSQRSLQQNNGVAERNVPHQSQPSTHHVHHSQQRQQVTQPRRVWNRFVRPPQAQVQNCWPPACPVQFPGQCQAPVPNFSGVGPGAPMFHPPCGPPRFENRFPRVMHPPYLPSPPPPPPTPAQHRISVSPPPSGIPMHGFPPQHFLIQRPLLHNPHQFINPFQVGFMPPPPPPLPPPSSSSPPPPLPPGSHVNFSNLTLQQIPPPFQ